MEFGLVEQIVSFAESLAGQRGVKLHFNITTNGTLLTDDKIHFLVQHGFRVWISCDGDKGSHDRYRVFRDETNARQEQGTYDVVARNIDRFVALYPEYQSRGISATLTATADPDACNDALRRMRESFPLIVANLVREASNDSETNPDDPGARVLCCEAACGGSGPIEREEGLSRDEGRDGVTAIEVGLCVNDGVLEQSKKSPEFCNWTTSPLNRFRKGHDAFVEELCRTAEGENVCARFPLFFQLFARARAKLHSRRITRHEQKGFFGFRCFAGASRTFCSSEGFFFPCERTERGKLFRLGDGRSGVDVDRAISLTEELRLLSDCGNCVVKRLCTFCFSAFSEMGVTGRADSLAFQRSCQKKTGTFFSELEEYTTIMEANGTVVDSILREEKTEGWLGDIRYVMTEAQLRGIEVSIEEQS